ncbi:MAG: peptidoglycan DD-metalloendopeptidase family protein [Eubacteriaceae bacterium]
MAKPQKYFDRAKEALKRFYDNESMTEANKEETSSLTNGNFFHRLFGNKSKAFKVKSACVIVSAFVVLSGAGIVDAQTRAYEILYNGKTVGYVDSPEVFDLAMNRVNEGKTAKKVDIKTAFEVRPGRSTEKLNNEEVKKVIAVAEKEITEKVEVAAKTELPLPVTGEEKKEDVVPPVEEKPVIPPVVEEPEAPVAGEEEKPEAPPVEEGPVVEEPAPTPEVPAPAPEQPAPAPEPTPEPPAPAPEPTPEPPAPVPEPTPEPPAPVPEPTPEPPAPAPEPTPEPPAPAPEPEPEGFINPTSGRVGEIWRPLSDYSGYYSQHYAGAAVDILNSAGTPIVASKSGTVIASGYSAGGYGNYIEISHGGGVTTLYAHMQSLYVGRGSYVEQGQVIGAMGSTGSSTANHLHFEILINDSAQPISNYFSYQTGSYI